MLSIVELFFQTYYNKNIKPTKKEKQIFWDYDLRRTDLSKPKIKKWFLSRKIKFGDFSGIKKSDLKKTPEKT